MTHRGGGTNIFATQGGTNIFTLRGGDKHFMLKMGDDDVDGEEEDVSEASKLSAGARIFRGL